MSEETFFSSVDNFTSVLSKVGAKKTRVSIYGGEPFTNKKVIHAGLRKIGKNLNSIEVDWVINTNGSLIADEDLEVLKDNDVEVHLSVDGPERIHNLSRQTLGGKDTFDRVLKGLERLKKAGIRIQLNSHIMPTNRDQLKSLVDLAFEHGIKKVYLDLSFTPDGLDAERTLHQYRDAFYHGIKRGVSILGAWSEPIRNQSLPYSRAKLIDTHTGIEVNVDGTYFFSTWTQSKKENHHIRDLTEKLPAQITRIRETLHQDYRSSCQNCSLFKNCYGVAKEHVRYHLHPQAETNSYCDFFRAWLADLAQTVFSLRTSSFFLTSTKGPIERNSPLVRDLIALDEEIRKLLPNLRARDKSPIHIHICSDFGEFSALAADLEVPDWTRLYASSGKLILLGSEEFPTSSLRHELMHVLFQRAKLHPPAWFDEGVSQLFADPTIQPPAISQPEIRTKLLNSPGVPLIHHSSRKSFENPFYQEALGMVLESVQTSFQGRYERFWAYIDQLTMPQCSEMQSAESWKEH